MRYSIACDIPARSASRSAAAVPKNPCKEIRDMRSSRWFRMVFRTSLMRTDGIAQRYLKMRFTRRHRLYRRKNKHFCRCAAGHGAFERIAGSRFSALKNAADRKRMSFPPCGFFAQQKHRQKNGRCFDGARCKIPIRFRPTLCLKIHVLYHK